MANQSHYWSLAAEGYEQRFIDPYREGTRNPLLGVLRRLARPGKRTAADFGCGTGPLLPFLSQHFQTVYAVDFAEGMLERSRQRCPDRNNIVFMQRSLMNLDDLAGKVDVAVAVNSVVMPDVRDQEATLRQVRQALKPKGCFLSILPAMDAVHYHTMLLVDRALKTGMPIKPARTNAGRHVEHDLYDFAFGQFHYQGLEQHFWQPFEVEYRFKRAGFGRVRLTKVHLAWEQFACGAELKDHPPPWDWFVRADIT